MKKAMLSIDVIIPPTEGYYDPSKDWNGWLCPYFPTESVMKILPHIPKEETGEFYRWEDGKLIYEYFECGELKDSCQVHGTMINHELCFPIGYNSWCWEVS